MQFKFKNNSNQSVGFNFGNKPVAVKAYESLVFDVSDAAPLSLYTKLQEYKDEYIGAYAFSDKMLEIYKLLLTTIGVTGFTITTTNEENLKPSITMKDYKTMMTVGESQRLAYDIVGIDKVKVATDNKEVIYTKGSYIKALTPGEATVYIGDKNTHVDFKINVIAAEDSALGGDIDPDPVKEAANKEEPKISE